MSASIRTGVWIGLRALGATAALVAIYYALPLDHGSTLVAVATLVVGLVALMTLVFFEVRRILVSQFPGLQAIEALGTALPLFLLLFAGSYVAMAAGSPGDFGEKLTHTDGIYFAVTVFSTVGFGDITAKSDGARLLVTMQMILDLFIIAVGAKVILGAVTRSRQRQPRTGTAGQAGERN
jgi:hypothetical protein